MLLFWKLDSHYFPFLCHEPLQGSITFYILNVMIHCLLLIYPEERLETGYPDVTLAVLSFGFFYFLQPSASPGFIFP
jgi:hypothetical protein